MKRILLIFFLFIAILVTALTIYGFLQLKDRHPDYHFSLQQTAISTDSLMEVAFSRKSINPTSWDSWNDLNGNYRYDPKNGDTFNDLNQNGKFDPIWLSGFSQNRPMQGIHDSLWAHCMMINNGKLSIAFVVLDAIGFGNDDVLDIRRKAMDAMNIDYVAIMSTHTHEAPDLIGMWGNSAFKSGVNKAYMAHVKAQAFNAIEEAFNKLRPAKLSLAQDLESAKPLVGDTREPQVLDPGIRLLHATDPVNGEAIGTLFSWANHPETLWDDNLLASSDFPHYVRTYMEDGIMIGDSLVIEGTHAICMYVNGAIGGLMTTHPSMGIKSFLGDTIYLEPSYEKASAQGQHLAYAGLKALEQQEAISSHTISISAESIYLPLKNKLFRLGAYLGVLDRGMPAWMQMRSEVSYLEIGQAGFLLLPGEIYPEIINGGITMPEGQDYATSPQEIPPLRPYSNKKFSFVLGLANDMIGYVIPKSQWDTEAPYTYGRDNAPYGEINSVGPETAPLLHQKAKALIDEVKALQD